jgi:hypothetical protein
MMIVLDVVATTDRGEVWPVRRDGGSVRMAVAPTVVQEPIPPGAPAFDQRSYVEHGCVIRVAGVDTLLLVVQSFWDVVNALDARDVSGPRL